MAQSARPGFAPPSSTTPCSGKHGDRRAQDDKKRQFLYACEDGCFPCVERLVLWEGVAPDSHSDTQGFSALDFAEWGEEQEIEGRHADVISFLQEQLSSARGSTTPEPDEVPPCRLPRIRDSWRDCEEPDA